METDTHEDQDTVTAIVSMQDHTAVSQLLSTQEDNGNDEDVKSHTKEEVFENEESVVYSEQPDTEESPKQTSGVTDKMPVLLRIPDDGDDVITTCQSPRPMSNDSGVTTDTDVVAAHSVSIPSTVISQSTDISAIVSSPESETQNMTNSGPSVQQPPPQTQPPVRRRPGRPPGSTKKYPRAAAMSGNPCGAPSPVFRRGTDFTLRKFFEAGGRDYNEYLEWLKRRDNGENVPFLNSNAVLSHVNHPQGAQIPGGPVPVVSYPNMPYPQRPVVPVPTTAAVPTVYHPVHNQPINGPIRVPGIAFYQPHHPQHRHSIKRATEEVLDLSAKKSKLDPNGNVIESGTVGYKTPPCGPTNGEAVTHVQHPMTSWGVDKVASFVGAVPGCQDYIEVFREQKIDGATLPHLSEEHLLNIVKMKLGPAIRLRLEVQKLTTVT